MISLRCEKLLSVDATVSDIVKTFLIVVLFQLFKSRMHGPSHIVHNYVYAIYSVVIFSISRWQVCHRIIILHFPLTIGWRIATTIMFLADSLTLTRIWTNTSTLSYLSLVIKLLYESIAVLKSTVSLFTKIDFEEHVVP